MKLALLGGGGVRAPLFVSTAINRADRIGLEEICLMDIDEEKMALIGGLCEELARQKGNAVRITLTSDPEEAIRGAKHIVTTIRVGAEQGRVLDERIALRLGVLGQETTGPGGFAMAIRNVQAIQAYAALRDRLAPGAWMYNFTNPAGLVTQALYEAGFKQIVGICDGANAAQHAVAGAKQVAERQLRAEVFGLNHLSWTRAVRLDGQDLLPPLLQSPAFRQNTLLRLFDPELIAMIGMYLNEYLYYYYYSEKAVASILSEEETRGEEILRLNRKLFEQLRYVGVTQNPQRALQVFFDYERRRSSTYMHYAQGDQEMEDSRAEAHREPEEQAGESGEGYAGLALGLIEAFDQDKPLYTALNVPNQGAIEAMDPEDVVEVSCMVDGKGIHPLPIGAIPEDSEILMRSVKRFERLTVEAIRDHSRQAAVEALMVHPLVMSYPRAVTLVDEYLKAHADYVGDWS